MPTYEYRCGECGYEFELFQSMTEDPVSKCPQCGQDAVERLISAGAGLIFKGSGFYITDYRSDSYKSAAKADKPSSSSSSATDTKKSGTDTKKSETTTKP